MPKDILVYSELKQLHDTIEEQISATNKQSRVMGFLTWAAVILAVVQTIGMVVQVWLAFR